MKMKISSRGQHAILGALVADTASLGLHWLYDQPRIREVAKSTPEFHAPNVADYANTAGYFAHSKKQSGDLSQYGEQAMVMLRTLADNHGDYDPVLYQTAFFDHFGYGGDYVGYIDRATRDTLDNIARAQAEAMQRAMAIPFDGHDEVKQRLVSKILAGAKQARGESLRTLVEQAVRITDDSDENVAHAFSMLDAWEANGGWPGSEDTQLPAVSKLPALIARYAGEASLPEDAESAIRVTNNNKPSIEFGLAATKMIEAAILSGDIESSIKAAGDTDNLEVKRLLDEALSMREQSTEDVTRHFGMACNLSFGLPSITHNLATVSNYSQAIRNNIYAGGDNCGRAIMLGAIAGACFGIGGERGIPEQWLDRLLVGEEANRLIESIG